MIAEQPWILFDYQEDSSTPLAIYAMHPDGSSLHPLDLDGARAIWPSISPDGKSLLYISLVDGEPDSVMLRDLATHASRTIGPLSLGAAGLGRPAVSPNNALIVYGEGLLFNVVSFDGSNDRLLDKGGALPFFSADSSRIYYSNGDLVSIDIEGTSSQTIEHATASATFSPDGSKVAAHISCDYINELRIYPRALFSGDPCAKGTARVVLHVDSGIHSHVAAPMWGPDDVIAYHDGRDVFLIDAAGGTPTNATSDLTMNGGWAGDPVWAPASADIP